MEILNRRWFVALAGIVLFACLFAALNAALRIPATVTVASYDKLSEARRAFARVTVGKTAVPDLAGLGFDASRPGTQTLSYLGVMEHFMPRTAEAFDRLNPAIQNCLNAQGHCTAYIFPLGHAEVAYDLFGTAAHASPIAGPRITFLIRGGRVAFKALNEE